MAKIDDLIRDFLAVEEEFGLYIKPTRTETTYRYALDDVTVLRDGDLLQRFIKFCRDRNFAVSSSDAGKVIPQANAVLKHITRGETFLPGNNRQIFVADHRGNFAINKYEGYSYCGYVPDVPPDLSYWDELLSRLFGADADYFENWLAYKLQHPSAHLFAWLVESEQGTGKTFLCESVVKWLVGAPHFYSPSKFPTGDFDRAPYANRLFLSYQDVTGTRGASHRAYEGLKAIVTDTDVEIEYKHENKFMAQLYCVVFVAYNTDRAGGKPPLALPADDRRFYTPARCCHRVSKEETANFFRRFAAELSRCAPDPVHSIHSAFHDALYDRLMAKDIPSDFDPSMPRRTERFDEVVDSCRDGLLDLVDELANFAVVSQLFVCEDLLRRPNDFTLARDALERAGFAKYDNGKQVTLHNKRRRSVWYDPKRFGGKVPAKDDLEALLNSAVGLYEVADPVPEPQSEQQYEPPVKAGLAEPVNEQPEPQQPLETVTMKPANPETASQTLEPETTSHAPEPILLDVDDIGPRVIHNPTDEDIPDVCLPDWMQTDDRGFWLH